MRFGLYSTAEYINMITLFGLAVTLFFGGWGGPWLQSIWHPLPARRLPLRLHLAARDAAAPALRPAHALLAGVLLLPVATLNALVTAILVALV